MLDYMTPIETRANAIFGNKLAAKIKPLTDGRFEDAHKAVINEQGPDAAIAMAQRVIGMTAAEATVYVRELMRRRRAL